MEKNMECIPNMSVTIVESVKFKYKKHKAGIAEPTIVTTRFNTETWLSNQQYRENHNIAGCFYSDQIRMSMSIPPKSTVFVVEMNNSLNRIEGIGLVLNKIVCDKHIKVHDDANYNRYTYTGKHRICRETLSSRNPDLVCALDTVLFKGKSHMKRGAGFTKITPKILANDKCAHINILDEICKIFVYVYHPSKNTCE
jgi:hypothetical protein